jgi:hypothetical protein
MCHAFAACFDVPSSALPPAQPDPESAKHEAEEIAREGRANESAAAYEASDGQYGSPLDDTPGREIREVVWGVWQWDTGVLSLVRLFTSEDDARKYAAHINGPERESEVRSHVLD